VDELREQSCLPDIDEMVTTSGSPETCLKSGSQSISLSMSKCSSRKASSP